MGNPQAKELALDKLQREINEYRKGGKFEGMFPERWLPAAVAVIGEPFTEQNGLVNSTMKIMRGKVEERYADRIAGLYLAGAKEMINEEKILRQFPEFRRIASEQIKTNKYLPPTP